MIDQTQRIGSMGPGFGDIARMGPGLGCDMREDDHEPVGNGRSAAQVHRAGQRRPECGVHQPQPRRHAPPHPRRARRRERPGKRFSSCSSAGRSCRSIRAALARRFFWRKRKPRAWRRRQGRGEHAGLRRDAGGRTMEHGVGSVLRARPAVDRRVLGDGRSPFTRAA